MREEPRLVRIKDLLALWIDVAPIRCGIALCSQEKTHALTKSNVEKGLPGNVLNEEILKRNTRLVDLLIREGILGKLFPVLSEVPAPPVGVLSPLSPSSCPVSKLGSPVV